MTFSIIVPVFNSESTLKRCLEAIYQSQRTDFEVIVVDDESRDRSVEIAGQFTCKIIRMHKNRGSGYAKNIGVQNSTGDILVFVDSDVVIKKNTLSIILASFDHDPSIDAVIGYFSLEHPNLNFFSQYKNIYMNFIFSQMPEQVDFLFTATCAIKKKSYLAFDEQKFKTDDTALGQRFKMDGKKILLNKDLQVIHLKKYSLVSFIVNDFVVVYHWAQLFLGYKGMNDILKKGRFAHARLYQILSIIEAYLIFVSLASSCLWRPVRPVTLVFILLFIGLNFKFFIYLNRQKGIIFTLKSVLVTYFDMLVMGCGILLGFCAYFFKKLKPGTDR